MQNHAGFSLVELLVVMVMFGIITTAAYNLFREQGRISRAQQSILDMQSNGRATMHILTQSFSHAGFGCSESNSEFLQLTNGDSDTVTVRYGYRELTTVSTNATGTDTISVTNSTAIKIGQDVSFYPSASPNTTYRITNTSSPFVLNKNVEIVPAGAKVFQVYPIEYSFDNNTLWIKDDTGTEPLSYDVVNFQMAYSLENPTNWIEASGNIKDPQAIFLYFIMRTKDKEPGYRNGNPFRLPWNNAIPAVTIEDGYHYQSFQTQIWVRNAD